MPAEAHAGAHRRRQVGGHDLLALAEQEQPRSITDSSSRTLPGQS